MELEEREMTSEAELGKEKVFHSPVIHISFI